MGWFSIDSVVEKLKEDYNESYFSTCRKCGCSICSSKSNEFNGICEDCYYSSIDDDNNN